MKNDLMDLSARVTQLGDVAAHLQQSELASVLSELIGIVAELAPAEADKDAPKK